MILWENKNFSSLIVKSNSKEFNDLKDLKSSKNLKY